MVWGLFGLIHDQCYVSRVKNTLSQKECHSTLQRHAVFPLVRGSSYIMHRKKEQDGKLENIEWPAQSLGRNPFKLVWDELDRVKAKEPTSVIYLLELLYFSEL